MSAPQPTTDNRTRPGLADSPWFWVYVFGAAALVALFAANFKFGSRQAQIEREFQARTRAAQQLNGQEPSLELSTPQNTLVTLGPLWILLAVLTIAGWLLLWQSRRSHPASSSLSSSSSAGSSHVDSGQ